jgi:hypothetical protein
MVNVLKKLSLLGRQKIFLIPKVVIINNAIFCDVTLCACYKYTDVSEEHTASFFKLFLRLPTYHLWLQLC